MANPRIDAKLKRAPAEQQEELWYLRNPPDGSKGMTLEELQLEVPRVCGFSISLSSLSEWLRWFALEREFQEAMAQADQVAAQLAKDPDIDPAKIKQVAQTVFTSRALKSGDVDSYVKLAQLDLRKEKQAFEREKLSAATKSKIEAGLDALFEQIKGNAKAERAFRELQETVKQA